jgi:hypothetical protein
VILFLLIAIGGLALIPTVTLSYITIDAQISIRQPIAGSLFSLICVSGILAAFYPLKCRRMFRKAQNPLPFTIGQPISIKIRGHHPECDKYAANRIKIGNYMICAACSGLLVGAIIALIGTVAYFFMGLNIVMNSFWLLIIGEAFMLLGLTQIKFSGYTKSIVNMLFVVGSFLALFEVDFLRKSLVVDLYMLGLIAFMLWLRILLSEWHNKRTCKECRLCFH